MGDPSRQGDPDAVDAARVLAGDVEAFSGIVGRWQGRLVNLAFRFCRDRARAEDMAQEAFLKAFRALASWRGEAAFSTWLTAVAVNVYRSSLRRQEPAFVGIEEVAAASGAIAADLLIERGDDRGRVRAAVARLPRRLRDAVTLFYFAELDVAAAAGALGIPEGTLKARLHRGRAQLRRRLARRGGEAAAGAVRPKEA